MSKPEVPEDLRERQEYLNRCRNDKMFPLDSSEARELALIERITALEADWARLNKVFKSTSDKTIDQDAQIARLEAQLKSAQAERDHLNALRHGFTSGPEMQSWQVIHDADVRRKALEEAVEMVDSSCYQGDAIAAIRAQIDKEKL